MDKFLEVFKLLYCAAKVNAEVDQDQMKIIRDYIQANYGNIKFDPVEIADYLDNIQIDELTSLFKDICFLLNDEISLDEKIAIARFITGTVMTDNVIDADENKLLEIMKDAWGASIFKDL